MNTLKCKRQKGKTKHSMHNITTDKKQPVFSLGTVIIGK